jgi:hypothetical protein
MKKLVLSLNLFLALLLIGCETAKNTAATTATPPTAELPTPKPQDPTKPQKGEMTAEQMNNPQAPPPPTYEKKQMPSKQKPMEFVTEGYVRMDTIK